MAVSHSPFDRRQPVGIVGSSTAETGGDAYRTAHDIAAGLAHAGLTILCGGRGGIMAAACHGAAEAGGLAIGILPGEDLDQGNPFASVLIPSGLGNVDTPITREPVTVSRNLVIANGAACLVAVSGGRGTADEVSLALARGKKVFAICGAPVPENHEFVTVYEDDDWSNLIDDVAQCFAPGDLSDYEI